MKKENIRLTKALKPASRIIYTNIGKYRVNKKGPIDLFIGEGANKEMITVIKI